MLHNLHPKCANPACATAFDWLAGGKFYRFHRNPVQVVPDNGNAGPNGNIHQVEHFWLCERCAQIYTLGYESGRGVFVHLQWLELPEMDNNLQLPVA